MPQISVIAPTLQREPAKLRVCAYARVSSSSEDQRNSFTAQVRYYTAFIANHDDWAFVDIYADEGITGTRSDKRIEFQRMMQDCRLGKIDQILVKSLSRFARNTQDCIEALRELRVLGVTVIFEKEHLNTATMANEMLISMMSAFAQEESVSISQNMRKGIRMRMKEGSYQPSQAPYGYRFDESHTLIIHEEEAAIVRKIYADFLAGKSYTAIAVELEQQNVPKLHGKAIWSKNGVRYILTNERYAGHQRLSKSVTLDSLPFRRVRNDGISSQYYIENTHFPIIDQDTFERVQELAAEKAARYSPHTKGHISYPLSSRLICAVCGAPLYRRVTKAGIQWACFTHKKSRTSCPTKNIHEKEVYHAFHVLIIKLRQNDQSILKTYLDQLYLLRDRTDISQSKLLSLKKQTATLLEQDHTLLRLKSKGCIDPAFYLTQHNEIEQQLSSLTIKAAQLKKKDIFEDNIASTRDLIRYIRSPLAENELPDYFGLLVKNACISNDKIEFTMKNGLVFPEAREVNP